MLHRRARQHHACSSNQPAISATTATGWQCRNRANHEGDAGREHLAELGARFCNLAPALLAADAADVERQQLRAYTALLLCSVLLVLLRFGLDVGKAFGQCQQIGHRQIATLLQFEQACVFFLQTRPRHAGVGDLLRQVFGTRAARGDIAVLAGKLHHRLDAIWRHPHADTAAGVAPARLFDRQQRAVAELGRLAGIAHRHDALVDLIGRQIDAHIVLIR